MSDTETNGAAATSDVKPSITYELTIQDGGNEFTLSVKVKPNTPIVKVLKVWCSHHKLDMADWSFWLDGERLNIMDGNDLVKTTIKELGIDEDCQIDANRQQVGGCQ